MHAKDRPKVNSIRKPLPAIKQPTMNAEQEKALQDFITGLVQGLRVDMEKEATSNCIQFDLLRQSLDSKQEGTKPPKSDLNPELFLGNHNEDAGEWIDFYDRIATLNRLG